MLSRKYQRSLIGITFFCKIKPQKYFITQFYNVLYDHSFLLVQQPLDPSRLQISEANCHAEAMIEVYHFIKGMLLPNYELLSCKMHAYQSRHKVFYFCLNIYKMYFAPKLDIKRHVFRLWKIHL